MLTNQYRADFPIFSHTDAVYLDNAATTQRPECVLQAVRTFYEQQNANPLRGLYRLSEAATEAYKQARQTVADFIHARSACEVVFTRNATEALNLVAYSYGLSALKPGDELLVSITSHHSNILPWQMVARKTGAKLRFLLCERDGSYSDEAIDAAVNEHTKLAAVELVSNVTGRRMNAERVIRLVHGVGGKVVLDGAQSVPHMATDVQALDCDFLAFSGHKMLAEMGIGVLWARQSLLDAMPPFLTGGEMIEYVTQTSATWAELPHKFEAGTVNAGGAVSLGEACRYLNRVGFEQVGRIEAELTKQCVEGMLAMPHVHIMGGQTPEEHLGIISFTVDDVHPHDIATILDGDSVCVRAGHHCAQPLMKHLGVPSSARVSMYLYNTSRDVEAFLRSLSTVRARMGYRD